MSDNYALYFNGSNYVNTNYNPNGNLSELTYEAWFRLTKKYYYGTIVGRRPSGFNLREHRQNNTFQLNAYNDVKYMLCNTSRDDVLNIWTYISATVDISGTSKIYINGINENSSIGWSLSNFIGNVYIGWSNYDEIYQYFTGDITEVRIWNIARNQTEIQENMNKRLKGNEDGLVAYYPMTEGSGNILYDHSGNNNHGTIYGANWVTTDLKLNEFQVTIDSMNYNIIDG